MNCEDLVKELSDYLDEELSPGQRRELEAHLTDCNPCQVIADTAQQTVKIVTGCGSFELPPKLSAKIMTKIRAVGGGKKAQAKKKR